MGVSRGQASRRGPSVNSGFMERVQNRVQTTPRPVLYGLVFLLFVWLFVNNLIWPGMRVAVDQCVLKLPGAHPNQQTSCAAAHAIKDLTTPSSNIVVFGIGWDAVMWARMVPEGSVKYLEHHTTWRKLATELLEPEKNVEVMPIFYTSSVWSWSTQFKPLDPTPVKAHSADITLVDSPEGFSYGRGPAILEAYRVTKPGGYIFLDDAKRIWERFLASSLLWPYCDCEMIHTRGGFLKCKVKSIPPYALAE